MTSYESRLSRSRSSFEGVHDSFVLSDKMVNEDGKHGFSSDGESRSKLWKR